MLKSATFSPATPEHLVKLAAAVGQANWTNRFNNAFGVELP